MSDDGITVMLPRVKMGGGAKKLRDTYAITPDAPFYRKEFGVRFRKKRINYERKKNANRWLRVQTGSSAA